MSGEREQDGLLLNAQSAECPAFSQMSRVTAPSPSVIGGGGLQTMGMMDWKAGGFLSAERETLLRPVQGFFAHFSNLFARSSASTKVGHFLLKHGKFLRKSPPLLRDSGGLFCGRAPRGVRDAERI